MKRRYVSQPRPSPSVESCIYSLQISSVLGPGLTSGLVCESVSADITLPISPRLRKLQATRTTSEVFSVSLYGGPTDGVQQHLRHVVNKEPITCPFTCISKASFHPCPLQRKFLLVSALAKHPTQLTFQRTLTFPLHGTLSKLLKVGLLIRHHILFLKLSLFFYSHN